MSMLNIYQPKSPTIGTIEFDAVLEDTFEASVTLTGYPIELGARASDHRIINPFKWSIIGAISNTPINDSLLNFVGGLAAGGSSNFFNSGVGSAAAGLSAGFLAGSQETRSSAALASLITLMTTGSPFSIDAGDIQLNDMVITRIRRTKDPENEGGLIFEADLQEYPTLKTVLSKNQPDSSQLNKDDPASSQASAKRNLGEKVMIAAPIAVAVLAGALL
jgi:hypothetical protein